MAHSFGARHGHGTRIMAASALIAGLIGLLFCACHAKQAPPSLDPVQLRAALVTYADVAWASYTDAADAWSTCQHAVDALLAAPSPQTLAAAQQAWLSARIPYQQTEAYRFYGGPIDSVEFLVNTWPIDEAFIESSAGRGIIDDVAHYPELTGELLVRVNGAEGETSISTGYHAIEFLLWGRDESALGPGARPYTDFVLRQGDVRVARRRRYLLLASALLASQLTALQDAWRPQSDNYRARFLAAPPQRSLAHVLKGMGMLSGPELAGERLTVPYETRDPENEQSCFSDSTQQDIVQSALGIANVCAGDYRRADGSHVTGLGVCALIEASARELGRSLRAQIAASVSAARDISAPFDRAIAGDDAAPGRQAIARTIRALETQTTSLRRIAAELALSERAQ
jgi:putative iron-regulated protein